MDGDNQWRIIRTSQQAYFMPGCTCAGARASGRVESERDVCLADGEWFTSLSFRSEAPHTHMWPFLRRSTLDAHPERLIDRAKQGVLCARHKLVLLYVHIVWAQSTVSLIIKIHTHCKIHIGVTYYLVESVPSARGLCVYTVQPQDGRASPVRTVYEYFQVYSHCLDEPKCLFI